MSVRDKAIAELVRIWHSPHLDLSLKAGLAEAIEALKPKTGHWIDEETNYLCSECHRGCWVNSDYCPWCGADMRGEEE